MADHMAINAMTINLYGQLPLYDGDISVNISLCEMRNSNSVISNDEK